MVRLGLALGGGGARGSAHVGVLIELERLGIRPQLISGTSVGGLVGGLLASGLSAEEILFFIQELSLGQLFSLPGGAPSFTGNSRIKSLLQETIGDITFEDLEIPLSVVTADLISRNEIVLDHGDLISALLATMALPVLLPPVERDGLVLIDGGIINNVPFDVVRARGATYVIAVDLTNTAPYGTPDEPGPPVTGVLARMVDITRRRPIFQIMSTVADIVSKQSLNARLAVSQPDLLLRPKLSTIGLFDFHTWEAGVTAGREAVKEIEPDLMTFKRRIQAESINL